MPTKIAYFCQYFIQYMRGKVDKSTLCLVVDVESSLGFCQNWWFKTPWRDGNHQEKQERHAAAHCLPSFSSKCLCLPAFGSFSSCTELICCYINK